MRSNKHSMKIFMVAPIVIFAGILIGAQLQKILIPRSEMLIYQAWFDRSEWRCGKVNRFLHPFDVDCELQPIIENPAIGVFLVGDSRADAIKTVFSEVAASENVAVYFISRNDPLYGEGIKPAQLIAEVEKKNAEAIVLHYSSVNLNPSVLYELVDLAAKHNIKISFIMPVPTWADNVPETLINHLKFGDAIPVQTFDDYLKINQSTIDMVSSVHYSEFRIYPVADVFCSPVCRIISPDGKPYYFDNNHLTLTGSRVLQSVFLKLISDLK